MTESMAQSRTSKVVLLSFGRVLSALSAVLTQVVLARVLTTRDFATYNQAMVVYQIAVPLLMMGLSQTLLFFLPGEARRMRAVLIENLVLLAGIGAVFSLFLLLGGNRLIALLMHNAGLVGALLLMAPYAVLILPARATDACLTARNRVGQLVVYNITSRLPGFVMVVTACLVWRSLAPTLLATVLGAAIALAPALWLMFRACAEGDGRPRLSSMLAMIKYSVPLGIGNALAGMAFALDKVLVSALCTPEQFAVYVLGATEIPLINILALSVMTVITPEMAMSFKQGRAHEAIGLWKRTTVKCGTLMLPVMGLLLVAAPDVVTFLFSEKYAGSALPLRVYALLIPIRMFNCGALLTAMDRTKLVTIGGGLVLVVNLAIALCLIPLLGPTGAAWATVFSFMLLTAFNLRQVGRDTGISMRELVPCRTLARLVLVAAIAAVPAFGALWLMPPAPWLRMAVGSLVYAATVAVLYERSGLLDVRGYVQRFFTRIGEILSGPAADD